MPDSVDFSKNHSVSDEDAFTERQSFTAPYPEENAAALSVVSPSGNLSVNTIWRVLYIAGLVALSLLIFVAFGWFLKYPEFIRKTALLPKINIFADNTFVENIPLGGLTYDDALQKAVSVSVSAPVSDYTLSVQVGPDIWKIPVQRFYDLDRNVSEALDRAYAVGRSITRQILPEGISPFEYRWRSIISAKNSGAYYYVSRACRSENISIAADQIADAVYKAPQNASLQTFDFNSKTFTFTMDQNGRQIERSTVNKSITAALETLNDAVPSMDITLEAETLLPEIRTIDLINSFGVTGTDIHTFDDDIARHICAALNGIVLPAGAELSLLTVMFQRLKSEVLSAEGIKANLYSDHLSAVAEMLCRAGLKSDLKILKKHTDASGKILINWPTDDLVFVNRGQYPVFITADFFGGTAVISLYGRLSVQ